MNELPMILYSVLYVVSFLIFISYLLISKKEKLSREQFEAWYISKFLNVMGNAQAAVIDLRNDFGGYDDHHIDGAWEAWNHCKR